jgi:hypothetical protein
MLTSSLLAYKYLYLCRDILYNTTQIEDICKLCSPPLILLLLPAMFIFRIMLDYYQVQVVYCVLFYIMQVAFMIAGFWH